MSFIGPLTFCYLLHEIEESLLEESFNENILLKKREQVGKTVIVCGEKFCLSKEVINEIPYFQNLFLNHEQRYGGATKYLIPSIDHLDPVLLHVIVRYLENNCKSSILFGLLPKEYSSLMLLQMFDALLLRPPIQLNMLRIKSLLLKPRKEAFQFQDDVIKYAFAIFYCQRNINWNVDTQYRESIIQNLTFVLTSSDICFQPRLKFHFKELVLNCVFFSKAQYESLETIPDDYSQRLDLEDIEIFGSIDHPLTDENEGDTDESNYTLSCFDSSYDSVFHSKISLKSEYAELFGKKFSRSSSRFSLCGKQKYLSYSSSSVLL